MTRGGHVGGRVQFALAHRVLQQGGEMDRELPDEVVHGVGPGLLALERHAVEHGGLVQDRMDAAAAALDDVQDFLFDRGLGHGGDIVVGHLVEMVRTCGADQKILAGEDVLDLALVHPGPPGDIAHADGIDALFAKAVPRRPG